MAIRKYYKTYYRCASQNDTLIGVFGHDQTMLWNSVVFNGVLEDNGSYSMFIPVWFTQVIGFPATDTFWIITPPAFAPNTFRFSWTATLADGSSIEYIVELIMLTDCALDINIPACTATPSDNLKVIAWLNREGGWSYFYFKGKRTIQVKIPEGKQYVQADYISRYNERPDVFDGEVVTTGSIPKASLDLLESLKYSVQAYVLDGAFTATVNYRPIIINAEDFIKSKTGDNFFDVTVTFIYAERVQIQTQ